MAENGTLVGDQKDVVACGDSGSGSVSRSPWKRPVVNPADSPVMGAETWPALSDVQQAKTADGSANDSQTLDGLQKPQGGGNGNSSHKHEQSLDSRHHRNRSKRNQNGMSPFPVPVPRWQPATPYVYPPMMPIPPPIPVHAYDAYGYQSMPPPFPGAHNQLGGSGSQIPMQAFVPPVHVMDASANRQPPLWPAVSRPNYSGRRPNVPEGSWRGGHNHMYPRWRSQRAFGPRDDIFMQQSTAPRTSMRPASYTYRPAPTVGGPAFPGTRPMYYLPRPPPGSIRAPVPPQFAPAVVNPLVPVLPPEAMALREDIVKQIEYYFSDENLPTDHYLICQMDDQGWVPISTIAGFRKVKGMSTDIIFILDALQSSRSVEVQGDKVRKRDGWSKYVVVFPSKYIDDPATVVKNNSPGEQMIDSTAGETTESLSESDIEVNLSSDKETLDNLLVMNSYKSVLENNSMKQTSSDEHALLNKSVVLHANIKAVGVEVLSNSAANVDNVSNDFLRTLMLDEEPGKEQKKGERDDHYSLSRPFDHYRESQDQKEPLKNAELERVFREEFPGIEEFRRVNEMATTANADSQKPVQAMAGALVA